jgi:hypothetical protein
VLLPFSKVVGYAVVLVSVESAGCYYPAFSVSSQSTTIMVGALLALSAEFARLLGRCGGFLFVLLVISRLCQCLADKDVEENTDTPDSAASCDDVAPGEGYLPHSVLLTRFFVPVPVAPD